MENIRKQTVLVVEDELATRRTMVDNLVKAGFNVIEATNGVEGLSSAISHHPDLILLDILMPNMDGLTMMHKLRAQEAYDKKVPIILLTVLNPDNEEIMKQIIQDEPTYFLVKTDWEIGEVIEKVKERLQNTIQNTI